MQKLFAHNKFPGFSALGLMNLASHCIGLNVHVSGGQYRSTILSTRGFRPFSQMQIFAIEAALTKRILATDGKLELASWTICL